VRLRVPAASVSLPDLPAREGVHSETPGTPFTPAWGNRLAWRIGSEPVSPESNQARSLLLRRQAALMRSSSAGRNVNWFRFHPGYGDQDFVIEIRRLTGDAVDVVFDSMGGSHIWRSRKASVLAAWPWTMSLLRPSVVGG
jgi:hypothetical protein